MLESTRHLVRSVLLLIHYIYDVRVIWYVTLGPLLLNMADFDYIADGLKDPLTYNEGIPWGPREPKTPGPEGWHKSWSNIFRISTKHQLQSINQTSAFRQNYNLKILTKPSSSKTMTKLQNNAWTSTSKSWPNLETLCSKSEQKFNFLTKPQHRNLQQILPIRSATVTTSTSFELASSHARITSIKFTKRQWVSEWKG